MTEAAEMTIKKSKPVAFESRAGDLTALYLMNDWMVAVVFAFIGVMSVWAALIIYRSIQTLKGLRKVEDDPVLKTEKDGKATTNEGTFLSCVEATEETGVVPEALESWNGEGWRREPMVRIPTINEDIEPIEGIPTTNEDLQTIRRRTTKESDGPYVERQIVEDFHLCAPPEEYCGSLCQHYEGLCQICGGLCHCSESLCQDDTHSQTHHTLGEEEQATIHHSLSEINSSSGQIKDTEVYNPEEGGLEDVELRNDCQRGHTEESEASHLHASANEPQEALPDMLTDSDLVEPDHVSYTEMQEVQYPDDDMTNNVSTDMILSDTDPIESLPGLLCGMDIEEVECPEDMNSPVTIMPQERPDMLLTDLDVNKPLADCVREEEVGCLDDGDCLVAFANSQESPENLTLSDIQEPDQRSFTEVQEEKCPGADILTSHVEVIYEKTRTLEGDMEVMVEDLCSHFPQVDDPSAGFEFCDVAKSGLDDHGNGQRAQAWNTVRIDPTERMTNPQHLNKQPDRLRSDPNRDCVHDSVMEGLSREPTAVCEREGVDKCMDTQVEKSCQKVEINIMEATMDYNEWITVSDADGNPDINHSSIDCSAEAERHLTETRHDSDFSTMVSAPASKVKETETASLEDLQGNMMAAVLPIKPHSVQVKFCIHYHTQSPWQVLAVTGNQPELGSWKGFIPLERGQDGFWASCVALPAERLVEWKFVLVENGEIQRWEESGNRHLETGRGGAVNLNKWWGYL